MNKDEDRKEPLPLPLASDGLERPTSLQIRPPRDPRDAEENGKAQLKGEAGRSSGTSEEEDDDKDQNRKDAVPLPTSEGLERSGFRNPLPPPPPIRSREDGSDMETANERKRLRREKQEDGSQEEVSVADGVNVNVSVQVSPRKIVPIGSAVERSEDDSGGQMSRPQPLALESGKALVQSKIGGHLVNLRSAARRSEVKSSETTEEGKEAHPCLFIDTILDVIFHHVVHQPGPRTAVAADVQNMRLVCKTWKTSATRIYRQTRPSSTLFYYYDQRGYQSTCGIGSYSLTKFMKTMKTNSMVPVQKYNFVAAVFCRKNLKMFREFLLLCGPETVELSMSIMTRDTGNVMLNLNSENISSLEMNKLKTLSLVIHENQQGQDKSEDHGLMKLLQLLLTAAKMLQEVKIDYRPYAYSEPELSQRDHAVQQLCLVVAKRLARTARKLELTVVMNETAFNNLAEMEAKLESFELRQGSVLESRAMYSFLQSQSTSLKYLQFWSPHDHTRLVVEFPQLNELVRLQLPDSTVSVTAPSHFAETFPKLHSLEIMTESGISTLLSTVKKPSGSLKVLDLANRRFRCPPCLIKKVAQSFPYLAELRIRPGQKETMREVFTYLDCLESLYIAFADFNQNAHQWDSLFSGLPEAECARIGRHRDFGTVIANELLRQPSIVNLKKLRKLEIRDNYGYELLHIAFTDVSAHFVFLEMDHLREIRLPDSAVQFSPRYMGLLRDKLVLQ